MSIVNNSIAANNSRYLQSLVDYVLDVKPYRTKLAPTGAVSEEYIFSDTVNVKIFEDPQFRAFLGADILPAQSLELGVRSRLSNSWVQDIISDGVRRTWPIANFTMPKFSSHASRDTFIVGTLDDYQGIAGLTQGVFDQRRFDFRGITTVAVNGVPKQDTVDYSLSHGVFSFKVLDIDGKKYWKPFDISDPGNSAYSAFNTFPGDLVYLDQEGKNGGAIKNITGQTFEAFYAVCVDDSPITLEIFSALDDTSVGTVEFGNTFTLVDASDPLLTRIEFDFVAGELGSNVEINDRFNIFPVSSVDQYRVVISPDAPDEIWHLIKVNPQRLIAAPAPLANCSLTIHAAAIEFAPESDWQIEFNGDGTYTLSGFQPETTTPLSGYPKTLSLVEGCSYEDSNTGFTITPSAQPFNSGDTFTWKIGPNVSHYKVYGSVSGWTTDIRTNRDAELGQFFWNGKIGFRIPKLEMFARTTTGKIMVSDGISDTWSHEFTTRTNIESIEFRNGAFLASRKGRVALASLDGQNWTDDIASVYTPYAEMDAIVLPIDGGKISVSYDAVQWAEVPLNAGGNIRKAIHIKDYSPGTPFPAANVAVGDGGIIVYSASAVSWANASSPSSEDLYDVIHWYDTQHNFIAVGNNGTILKSNDRINWVSISSGITGDLRSVTRVGNALVAVGTSSTVIRSVDNGDTWNPVIIDTQGRSANFLSVDSDGTATVIATAINGFAVKSIDVGATWNPAYVDHKSKDITFGNGVFVSLNPTPIEPAHVIYPSDGTAISSLAEPSVYTVTFTRGSDIANNIPGEATVYNNILGYGKNLKTGEQWSDRWVKFTLEPDPEHGDYLEGEQVRIYLTDDKHLDRATSECIDDHFSTEVYPLYHSHGAVIFEDLVAGDEITIDKAFEEKIYLSIRDSSSRYPELGAVNDTLPLYFKYSDFADATNDFDTSLTRPADYSDIAPFIEAFSSATGQRVFYIRSPRYLKTNRAAESVLTFDEQFFNQYLEYNSRYQIAVHPQDSYNQHIRVKMSEQLKIYARIELDLNDIVSFTIVDSPIDTFEHSGIIRMYDSFNVQFIEGGGNLFGYDLGDYDDMFDVGADFGGYDEDYGSFPIFRVREINETSGAGVETGSPESAASNIAEGLSITMNTSALDPEYPSASVVTLLYDFDKHIDGITVDGPVADKYIVNMVNPPGGAINLTVAPESDLNDTTVVASALSTFTYLDEFDNPQIATDANALAFTPPGGLSAPFRIWLA